MAKRAKRNKVHLLVRSLTAATTLLPSFLVGPALTEALTSRRDASPLDLSAAPRRNAPSSCHRRPCSFVVSGGRGGLATPSRRSNRAEGFGGPSAVVFPDKRSVRGDGSFDDARGTSTPTTIASSTALRAALDPGIASLLSGSVAGAVGVGVAFPLDTLKTKAQVLGQRGQERPPTAASIEDGGGDGVAALAATPPPDPSDMNMAQLIALILRSEGVAGFFGGVRAMMIGQAFIKATAFSANSYALTFLHEHAEMIASVTTLVLAAAFSGFVTSFLVAPVERVKVMMQASGSSLYRNEIDCARAVITNEGWEGLFGRGLGPTLAREVPSYAIYFVVYGLLMQTPVASSLGGLAPLVFGAMSGCACWIPVYPIDVVKTLVQNTEGGGKDDDDDGDSNTTWDVARALYEEGGVGAFFDGLTPKMLRAAVNHSVTFYMYDLAMRALTGEVAVSQ